jgi:mono/diheme cytochrome c family protein
MSEGSRFIIGAVCGVLALGLVLGASGQEMFDGAYIYQRSCATCHGDTGEGIGLFGPNLRENAFVRSSNNEALGEVIQMGRKYRDKHHPEYAGMPRFQFIRAGELRALIDFVKGPLQGMEGEIRDHH